MRNTMLTYLFQVNLFNYDTLLPKTEKQCMNYFLHKVSKSDLLLVNLDNSNSSVGTGMEVQKAFDTGIPIIDLAQRIYIHG